MSDDLKDKTSQPGVTKGTKAHVITSDQEAQEALRMLLDKGYTLEQICQAMREQDE